MKLGKDGMVMRAAGKAWRCGYVREPRQGSARPDKGATERRRLFSMLLVQGRTFHA